MKKWDNTKYRKLTGKTKQELVHQTVWNHLKNKTCVTCPENNPLVLQFDHLDPSKKSFDVSHAISKPYQYSIIRLEMEIQKCQVLCANCHTEKTARLRNSWRLKFLNSQ